MLALQIFYRMFGDSYLFRSKAIRLFSFLSRVFQVFMRDLRQANFSPEMLVKPFRREVEAVCSEEPICPLVFIGLASAGRCKVGFLVFQWLVLGGLCL